MQTVHIVGLARWNAAPMWQKCLHAANPKSMKFISNSFQGFCNVSCFTSSSGARAAEDTAEAGWVSSLTTAWRDRPQQHRGHQGVQPQVLGRRGNDPGWLQPAAQAAHSQGEQVVHSAAVVGITGHTHGTHLHSLNYIIRRLRRTVWESTEGAGHGCPLLLHLQAWDNLKLLLNWDGCSQNKWKHLRLCAGWIYKWTI